MKHFLLKALGGLWLFTLGCFIIAAYSAIGGCTVYGGVAMHSEGLDAPEVTLENPIGIVGAEAEFSDGYKLFVEHHSGIEDFEDGYGYNLIGVKYEYKLF